MKKNGVYVCVWVCLKGDSKQQTAKAKQKIE